jgi:hypothetical protein
MEMERRIQQMFQQLLANHEKVKTNGKADLESLERMMEEMLRANQDELKETTACNGATETEPDPGMIQSIEEHQEISKGEVSVMLVGELRKRRMVQNLSPERRQKRKEMIQGKSGSRRKSAATGRKVSRHEKVDGARRISRKECTRANVVHEIQRGRTFGRRRQQEPQYSNGIRSRGVEVHLGKGRKIAKSTEEGGDTRHDWKAWETVTRSIGKPWERSS